MLTRANAVTTNKRVYQKVSCMLLAPSSTQHSQHSLSDVLSSSCLHCIRLQDTIQREVDRYRQSHIRCGTAYGELDHPSYDSVTFKDLHMATVSHQVMCASQSAPFRQWSSWFSQILHACFTPVYHCSYWQLSALLEQSHCLVKRPAGCPTKGRAETKTTMACTRECLTTTSVSTTHLHLQCC